MSQHACNCFNQFTLTVPPQSMLIMDESGQSLEDTAGPYYESSHFKATCQAIGGKRLNLALLLLCWLISFNFLHLQVDPVLR